MTPSGNAGWRVRNSVLQRLWNDTKWNGCKRERMKKHLSVYEYEKKMRKAEVEELEQEISSQKDIIAD